MSKLLPSSGFKWRDLKEFGLNEFTTNSLKARVLKVDLEYPKELCELHNDYPLAPDKIEIKKNLSKYQLMIADVPIGIVKKLLPNLFDKKKYVLNY